MPSQIESPATTLSIVALSASFISERRYLQNVSPKTLEWYKCSFKAFEPYLAEIANQNELRNAVRKAVMEMSRAGKLSPTSINDYARCINASGAESQLLAVVIELNYVQSGVGSVLMRWHGELAIADGWARSPSFCSRDSHFCGGAVTHSIAVEAPN